MSMEINIIKEQVKNIIIESMELGISPNEIDGTDLIRTSDKFNRCDIYICFYREHF